MGPPLPWTGWTWRWNAARSCRSSARTAPARPPPSRYWRATDGATPARPGSWARTLSAPGRHGGPGRGIVLQTSDDVADLTVSECVRHFSHFYPDPAKPEEVIERVGLTAKSGSRIRALSGGQRRRLDVALGIVGRPELVFLDEPTTGFDPEARRQFWEVVRDLAKEGTSVLLTTHYLEEAEALADRVAVINHGRVVATGPPAELGGRQAPPRKSRGLGPTVGSTARPTNRRRSSSNWRQLLAAKSLGSRWHVQASRTFTCN